MWRFAVVLAISVPAVFAHAQQTSLADTGTSTPSDELDSQLLEGLGSASQQDGTPETGNAETEGHAAPSRGDGVIDPFSRGSDVGQRNPLVEIGEAMQRVEKLLVQRKMSQETQASQQQIVDRLDSLIEALASTRQARTQRQRRPNSGDQGDQPGAKTGREAARNDAGPADEQGAGQVPSPTMQGPVSEIWGHLPDRYRRQIRSASAIEFLPKYRKLIEDYYKRLAEDREGP